MWVRCDVERRAAARSDVVCGVGLWTETWVDLKAHSYSSTISATSPLSSADPPHPGYGDRSGPQPTTPPGGSKNGATAKRFRSGATTGHGHPRQADIAGLALAELICREADRNDASRVRGSCRCIGEHHLRRVVKSYADYYNSTRTHRSLNKDAPISRPVQSIGCIISHALVGGLHHRYARI